jgi:hypothetical protein
MLKKQGMRLCGDNVENDTPNDKDHAQSKESTTASKAPDTDDKQNGKYQASNDRRAGDTEIVGQRNRDEEDKQCDQQVIEIGSFHAVPRLCCESGDSVAPPLRGEQAVRG